MHREIPKSMMMIVLARAEATCTNKGRVIVGGMMLIMIANADIQDF